MTWEIRNVGWPIPYNDTWPISYKKYSSQESLQTESNQYKIEVYGYDWFAVDYYKGRIINAWV